MRNNSFWLERMLWMVNCIRFRNVNDTYKDDMNSFWIGFTTWISQKNVRENLFTEEYVKLTGEKFEQNISFYNTQYRMYYEKEYPPVAQRISDLQAKAKDIIRSQDYKNMRVMIPDDYLDTEVIYEIARILKNRRAKSLSEAINLYEADLHQQRMEAAANRTADANERTANANEKSAAYSEKIAKNTKSAARAAKLNAFINFMK